MTIARFEEGAKLVRGFGSSDAIGCSIVDDPVGNPATVVDTVVKDVKIRTKSWFDATPNFRLVPNVNKGSEGMRFASQTPDVCSVESDGHATVLKAGTCKILLTSNSDKTIVKRELTSTPYSEKSFVSYESGSLARHVWDAMMALINGKTPTDATLLNYSVINDDWANPVVVRNASNFAASLDLSGMSVMRADNGNGFWPAALVSKRHFIAANHVTSGAQFAYCWMAPNGTMVKATPISSRQIPGTDLLIGYLDQDIPAGIKRFKVLPSNYRSYLPSSTDYWLPSLSKRMVVGSNQGAWVNTPRYDALRILSVKFKDTESAYYGSNGHYAYVPVIGKSDPTLPYAAWEWPLHNGDSCGPSWLVINGEAVLLGHYAEVTGSPHIADYMTQVEAAMNAMASAAGDATSYSLQKADLSAFTAY